MKIVAISGSPRERSFTDSMLQAFLQGTGGKDQATIFYPHQMKISHCTGCWECWTKTKGVCRLRDEMQKILPEMEQADLLIFAFPLYVDGMPSHVKKVFDRMMPLVKGEIVVDEAGHSRHPKRHPKEQKVILISSCGFPEPDNFNALKTHFKAICLNSAWDLCGELCISAAGAAVSPMVANKLKLMEKAGEMFMTTGRVSAELESEISREVFDRDIYRGFATAQFEGKPLAAIKGLLAALVARFKHH